MWIGRIFGIQILLHSSFLISLCLFAIAGLLPQALILFSLVFLHELAHGAVAILLHFPVEKIELFPFGGRAQVSFPLLFRPKAEMAVAIAGPLWSLALGGLCIFLRERGILEAGQWTQLMISGNLSLGLFNLLPILPLDGGRVLRAALSRRLGFRPATEKVARGSQLAAAVAAALSLAAWYLWGISPGFLPICLYLYCAAREEAGFASYSHFRYLLHKQEELASEKVLLARHLVAEGATTLEKVITQFAPGSYHLVTVVTENLQIRGVVGEAQILEALFQGGTKIQVLELLL